MTQERKICCVIGFPVKQSLSPQVHTAGYKALGIEDEFSFIPPLSIKPEALTYFMRTVSKSNIRGVSVTIPHKVSLEKQLKDISQARIDPVAHEIGAINTVVNHLGKLTGYNTDWIGAARAVENVMPIKDKHVAIIGAGGAARALVYAAQQRGASSVVIYNRTLENAENLAQKFRCEARSLDDITYIEEADIIMQGTDIGMGDKAGTSLVPKQFLHKGQVVFDVVFNPHETQLLKDAREKGAAVVYGKEMLLQLVLEQFKMYTGKDAPEKEMRESIGLNTI